MTTLYVAGPMSGLPEFNYPAFHQAEKDLTAAGYVALNPAHTDKKYNPAGDARSWAWYMRHALRMLTDADGVALLIGWQQSRGATIERNLARDLDMPVHYVADWIEARARVGA